MTIHAIILTLNEELHIGRCLESIKTVCNEILVVDSGSSDRTVEIAESYGAKVVVNPYTSYGAQFNFGMDALGAISGWILRIDADEVINPINITSLSDILAGQPQEVHGLMVKRRMHFMGRAINWGGMDPIWQLRIFRTATGRCEERWQDPHIAVTGRVVKVPVRIEDINLRSLEWWTAKHSWYASREALVTLDRKTPFLPQAKTSEGQHGKQVAFKRLLKNHVYLRLPPAVRSCLYFFYRYFLRLGFLDGRQGFYFHLLQGLWYRTLVDAKIDEILAYARTHNCDLAHAARACTGIDPGRGSLKA